MQPDRTNYEIWIADWLAGTLTGEQKQLLREFLEMNPELKEEAEFLLNTTLIPGKNYFEGKDLLRRDATDLSPSQLEYLSVAFLENDLSPEQLADLTECTDKDPGMRKIFEPVQKIRLTPPAQKYRFKNRLRKRTLREKIIRMAYTALSAAASVAILIISYVYISHNISRVNNKMATDVTNNHEPVILYAKAIKKNTNEISPEIQINQDRTIKSSEKIQAESGYPPVISAENDSLNIRVSTLSETDIIRIADLPDFNFSILPEPVIYSLVRSYIEYREPIYDDRNGLSRFLARSFREKILRDSTGYDAPVKVYEIASAGINGISRVFGLNIALLSVKDEQGDLKSLYFSSRLLKINAPVKKDESLQ